MKHPIEITKNTVCYHCGDECTTDIIKLEEKTFCCQGCKTVYEIINQSGLCEYYDIEKNPGLSQRIEIREGKFGFLDDETVINKLVHFSEKTHKHVTFYLPQMHCSSCIWLLEHLNKINNGILKSTVNFLRKEITIVFDTQQITLRKTVEILTSVGYEPHISLNDISDKKIKKYDKARIYKIGITGFCFGNIMLLSFPEYFNSGDLNSNALKNLFSYLNLGLSLPVFFYGASEFFTSAFKSLRQKFLNIDAPIALAILITFSRSLYEIISGTGAGYLDSMSGIVFFMLLGRFFQNKTYESLSFDRNYKSYFPLGVNIIKEDGSETQIPVSKVKVGNRIKIHHGEIIPADSILFLGKALIDYSFVTGESVPTEKSIGEILYAGGKQMGGAIELEVVKEVSQSYLTQLWNNDAFKKDKSDNSFSFIHKLSRQFTYVLFSIALLTGIYWFVNDISKFWTAVTAILIVACPCALLLSATFTNGSMLRYLQMAGFYPKNAEVLEKISNADTIVFDKTGTITAQDECGINYFGSDLNYDQKLMVRSLANQSNHPLSRAIVTYININKSLPVKEYKEIKGKGATGYINNQIVKIGSADFIFTNSDDKNLPGSNVYISINNEVYGHFLLKNTYRNGLTEIIGNLKPHYKLSVLSGDNDNERSRLEKIFGSNNQLLFNQKPQDKLEYIKALQQSGKNVIMIGDGLNDAGALMQSNVGIVITDNINNFSPSCDAILDGSSFIRLKKIIDYCRREKFIITGSFVISVLYNLVGLFYSVQGTLEPVIAAILMPVSSASIILFTTSVSSLFGKKLR